MGRRVVLLILIVSLALVVAGGVALAAVRVGTNGDDRLRGTNNDDAISGLDGDDVLLGLKGDDAMTGGDGRDAILGGNEVGPQSGDRALSGGDGGDFVGGGRGRDGLAGGNGRDYMFAGPPNDTALDGISAGAGRDAVVAYNKLAAKDVVACGSGYDRALVDAKDDVSDDCERVYRSPRAFFDWIPGYYFQPLP